MINCQRVLLDFPLCTASFFRRTRNRAPGGNFWNRDKAGGPSASSLAARYVDTFSAGGGSAASPAAGRSGRSASEGGATAHVRYGVAACFSPLPLKTLNMLCIYLFNHLQPLVL